MVEVGEVIIRVLHHTPTSTSPRGTDIFGSNLSQHWLSLLPASCLVNSPMPHPTSHLLHIRLQQVSYPSDLAILRLRTWLPGYPSLTCIRIFGFWSPTLTTAALRSSQTPGNTQPCHHHMAQPICFLNTQSWVNRAWST